jgi:polyhydroxyalkanoate synthesis repressor PhaR
MSQPERLIKKYANRRLYDASQSRHVTLDDIREFIVQGEKVRVVEDKTGEDITRLILLQVIAEQEQFGKPILSSAVLESIIRFYGNGLQDFMTRYLEKSVEAFSLQQEQLQAQVTKLMTQTPAGPLADIAKQNLEYWAKVQEQMISTFMPSSRRTASTPPPDDEMRAGAGGSPVEGP